MITEGSQATALPQGRGLPRWTDGMFSQPYVDADEWRDEPVRHRHVHGGFKGTETRFSFYFPPPDQYEGRFFQPVSAIAGDESFAEPGAKSPIAGVIVPIWHNQNTLIGFAGASGAYLVVTNNGSTHAIGQSQDPGVNTVIGYRAGAAAAQYSRDLASEMYGPHRPYGYIYGGSGGSLKTVAGFENTNGVWDGMVPYIYGTPMAMPNVFTVSAHAHRLLKDKWRSVVDALDPGGSGDMYAALNQEEAEALREATRMGFPPRTWFAYEQLGYGPLAWLINALLRSDPQYFDDFWNVSGYLGANPTESLKRSRIQQKTTITRVITARQARTMGMAGILQLPPEAWTRDEVATAIQVKEMPSGELQGASLAIKSGAATGTLLSIMSVTGGFIILGVELEQFDALMTIKVGDELEIDNSIFLAAQTYHRHQVPTRDYYVFDQFRGADGRPVYPQRQRILGPDYARGNSGAGVHEGWIRYPAKVIMVETTLDEYAHPWSADWFRNQVKSKMGDQLDDVFRVWFVDNAMHGPPISQQQNIRLVEYANVLEQALRDLSAWVEKGVAPPASTSYRMVDGQVVLEPIAAERKGVQPVVTLTVNGGARGEVAVGESITFSGAVEVPPNAGKIVSAEWDFEGGGTYPIAGEIKTDRSGTRATVTATYSFSKPGTYFPALRASSQRRPDGTHYALIPNLARARVVVR